MFCQSLICVSVYQHGEVKGRQSPKKHKSLQGLDRLLFNPDWETQGRQTRITFTENIFGDVEKALYEKGVTKVQFLKAVDETIETLDTLVAFPPWRAITRYLEPRLEEIKKDMEETPTQDIIDGFPLEI